LSYTALALLYGVRRYDVRANGGHLAILGAFGTLTLGAVAAELIEVLPILLWRARGRRSPAQSATPPPCGF
jgi:hypothetical protein